MLDGTVKDKQIPVLNEKGDVVGSRDPNAADQMGGIGINLSLGSSKSQSKSTQTSDTAAISRLTAVLALQVPLFAASAHAGPALANAKDCLVCHELKTKKVGPAYLEVAKKYAGEKDAATKLEKKVLDGGSGAWGEVAMPANKTIGVTEADAKKLVAWMLRLK